MTPTDAVEFGLMVQEWQRAVHACQFIVCLYICIQIPVIALNSSAEHDKISAKTLVDV